MIYEIQSKWLITTAITYNSKLITKVYNLETPA